MLRPARNWTLGRRRIGSWQGGGRGLAVASQGRQRSQGPTLPGIKFNFWPDGALAWLNNSRRLAKDYEISVRSSQAVCNIAAFRTLLKRF